MQPRSASGKTSASCGAFARRIVPGAEVLTIADLWRSWCAHNHEPQDANEAGGIGKRRLSGALRDHVNGLPAPTPFSHRGAKVRGWRGWQLLDEAPETMAIEVGQPDDSFIGEKTSFLLDGEEVPGAELWRRFRAKGAGWRLNVVNGTATIDEAFVVDRETPPLPGL